MPAPVVTVPAVSPVVPTPAAATREQKPREGKTSWVSSSTESKSSASRETSEFQEATFLSGASDTSSAVEPAQRASGKLVKVAAATVVGLVVIGAVALMGARRFWAEVPAPPTTATLVVTTNPAGAEAFVDGIRRGSTPITLQLLAGSHNVELRGTGEPRVIPITLAPGQQVAQYVDLPPSMPPVETHAEAAPAPPVAVERAAAEAAANSPGWIAVSGKLEVQLLEDGHLLGTSKIERIMVPAGHHDLEMVNDLIGYRGTRSIQVAPGKVTNVLVDVPKGTMAINALPSGWTASRSATHRSETSRLPPDRTTSCFVIRNWESNARPSW
jgi:hypothetical protein